MSEKESRFQQEMDELRKLRDGLRVKAHLAKLEAEDAWHELERRWDDLEAKSDQIRKESGEAVGEIQAAAKLLASELRDGYEDIKRRILS